MGSVSAQGGAGNDIRLWVLSEDERAQWAPGRPVLAPTYYSGQLSVINLDVPLEEGQYYVLLDNTFSIFSTKTVAANLAVLVGPPSIASVTTDFQEDTTAGEPCETALVLSIGDLKGLAHIGVIQALKDRGIEINCIFGNSMGSLVGSLYAALPDQDVRITFQSLMAEYTRRTTQEVVGTGAIFGTVATIATGGAAAFLMAALVGGLAVDKFDNPRFRGVLNDVLANAEMRHFRIPFATSYQQRSENGLDLIVAGMEGADYTGNAADAVSRSVNNPFLFVGTALDYIDPGADRVSMTPMEDACAHFKPDRMIVVNVTGSSSFFSNAMTCDYQEIVIPPDASISRDAMLGVGSDFERVFQAGYDAVSQLD